MSRPKIKRCVYVVVAATTLAGCSDIYFDRRESIELSAGDSLRGNQVVHMVDPWPVRAGDRNIPHDGERMAAAAERYRTDKVKSLSGTGTSSVKYEPVLLQPGSK